MKIKKLFSQRGLVFLKDVILGIFTYNITRFDKKRELWLIAERFNEARDNGYHLYKYIRKNYKDENVYYVIDKKSKDYEKIKELENIIQFNSFKHHIYYWKATKLISTHINGYMPNEKAYNWIHKILKNDAKKVFLQHGIIKDFLPQLSYENTKLDLFVCGAKPEYEYVKNKYGYSSNQVQYLGLCRYDNLNNNMLKNQILVMPTFRMQYYIEKYQPLTKEKIKFFLNGQFYKKYTELLNNKFLMNELEKKKTEIVFYPHYEMQKYLKILKKDFSQYVKIADNDKYDIQDLLKQSKLLITDFSSVFFDFAYMGKPIIYFQFDKNEYRNKHYKRGYFFYERDGFGKVETETDMVVKKILEYINNNYKIENVYVERANNFFSYRDTNNCKRNYEAIKRL